MKKRFPFDKIKQNSRIIIYGAGVAGRRCYSQAVSGLHYCDCLYFVDKRSAEIKKDSISVYGMDTLYAQPTSDYDYVLVAIDDDAISEDVRYELISGGIASEKIVLQEDVLIDH